MRGALRSGRGVDIVGAIHRHHIVQVALPAERDTRRCGIGKRGLQAGTPSRDSRTQQGKIGKQPAADRQGLNLLGLDHLADFAARRLNVWYFRTDGNLLCSLCNRQSDLDRGYLTNRQSNSGSRVFSESLVERGQFVIPRRHVREYVISLSIRSDGAELVRAHVAKSDGGLGAPPATLVKDRAVKLCLEIAGLRESWQSITQECGNGEDTR